MRISDWSSDVCSSDLGAQRLLRGLHRLGQVAEDRVGACQDVADAADGAGVLDPHVQVAERDQVDAHAFAQLGDDAEGLHRPAARAVFAMQGFRSEEHTSELQSLMRISYAVFCLKKKNTMST